MARENCTCIEALAKFSRAIRKNEQVDKIRFIAQLIMNDIQCIVLPRGNKIIFKT